MVNWHKTTKLHYAARDNDVAATEAAITEGVDVDSRDRDGFTPLHYAAQEYSVDVAIRLLDAGADVDAQNKHGNTPLWTATFEAKGRGEMILLLRGQGADPHHRNKAGRTPVDLAHLIANYDNAQFFEDLAYDAAESSSK